MRTAPVLVLLAIAACGDRPPAGVTDLVLEAPSDHHARHGFVNMVPPVHLPSSSEAIDQVEVWLRVPDDGVIDVRPGPAGQPLLAFPVGTIADRVEHVGSGARRRVADIRGAEIVEGGEQRFHVYRPTAGTPDAPLFGVAWARDDAAAHRAATDRLIAGLDRLHTFADAGEREAFLRDVRAKNACLPCHAAARPENATQNEHGLVNRGTDLDGFFTPASVLRDAIPLESYGAFDRTLSDPAIEIACAGAEVDGRRCANDRVPVGTWQPLRAWADDPERASAICAARRYLLDRMSEAARARFENSLAPCNR